MNLKDVLYEVDRQLALNAVRGDVVTIEPAEALGMSGPITLYMRDLGNGNVRLTYDRDSTYGPEMPAASVRHFVNDLEGRVDLPPSGVPTIDAVLSGAAELLGKGDDGVAFRVGDEVVKVSTTVPYQPTNPGHLTPEAAVERMRQQTSIHNQLAGVARCLDPAIFVEHGDKGFQIKPYVEAIDPKARLSREQLDDLQDCVVAIHQAGYAIHDAIQVGVGADGRLVMFDVGKASRLSSDSRWRKDEIQTDMNNLGYLYQAHGRTFVRRDIDEGEQRWQQVHEMVLRNIEKLAPHERLTPVTARFLANAVRNAAEKRRDIARVKLDGDALAACLRDIDEDEAWQRTLMEGA